MYRKLFLEDSAEAKKHERLRLKRHSSILDTVRDRAGEVNRELGKQDQRKFAEYLDSVRSLEKKIELRQPWLDRPKPKTEMPEPRPARQTADEMKIMIELMALAIETDSTRVMTLSLDWIYGAITVPGATGGWHTLSHHGGKQGALEKLSRIEMELIKHLNQFLVNLDQIPEDGGTLLDNTTVVIGSNFGDASKHTCNNLPTIVAGGGYKHQAHTVLEKPTHLCDLYLELLHKHDIDAGSFGNGEKDLNLLKG